jgi:hypothetical protein
MLRNLINTRALALLIAASSSAALLSSGCGSDDKDEEPGGGDEDGSDGAGDGADGADGDGSGDETYSVNLTLVSILAVDTSSPIPDPHKVRVLDATTGEPLDPPIEATSERGSGKVKLDGIPKGQPISIYVEGVGPASTPNSTYDTCLLNFNVDAGDPLLRISSAGTYTLAANSGGYEAEADRAALSGGLYWAPEGPRQGTVGCAQLCVDGSKMPNEEVSQRYIGPSGLPTTLDEQSETNRSGRFYLGNLTKGKHKMRASLDECETFIGEEVEFFVPVTRADAKSDLKAVLLQFGFDIALPQNPTPSDCPAM